MIKKKEKILSVAMATVALASCGGGNEPPPARPSFAEATGQATATKLAMQPQIASAETTPVQLYLAFYGRAPSNPTYNNYLATMRSSGPQAVALDLASQFSTTSDATAATTVLNNIGITAATTNDVAYAALSSALAQIFSVYPDQRGIVILNLVKILENLKGNATYGAAARTFNSTAAAAYAYSTNPANVAPPLIYQSAVQPLTYAPYTGNSYYSPPLGGTVGGTGITNYTSPAKSGAAFPADFAVQVMFSFTLAYYRKDGTEAWTRPSVGRYVSAYANGLVANGNLPWLVDVLNFEGALKHRLTFDASDFINYARIEGDRLIIVHSSEAPVDVFEWSESAGKGKLLFQSTRVQYARAASINGDLLAIADTFGQRTVIQNMATGEITELPAVYPNDVAWVGEFLYVVEEHNDRILAFGPKMKKYVVMAAPVGERWNAATAEVSHELCGESRSKASDVCSGAFTLYAPNGFSIRADGMYVADTDNSRVIYVKEGLVTSVLTGLNNPTKIVEIPGT